MQLFAYLCRILVLTGIYVYSILSKQQLKYNIMITVSQWLFLDKAGRLVNSRKEEVFLQQGDMDGACSIYSMMMSLIACTAIKRDVATDIWKHIDGRTREARLINAFFKGKDGMFRDGMYLKDLADRLDKEYGTKVYVNYNSEEDNEEMSHSEFISKLCEDLRDGLACLIGIDYQKDECGHAMLAVGYEEDEDGEIFRLFCLDPGRPIQPCSYWNAVLDINPSSDRYLPDGTKVRLTDYITIAKKGK